MIKGVGCDIVKIARIQRLIEIWGKRFLSKIFTPAELAIFPHPLRQYSHFAKRFAAKEACVKALGTGFSQDIAFHDIEIFNNSDGAPYLNLSGNHSTLITHLSLSDEKEYAMAFVIIESR